MMMRVSTILLGVCLLGCKDKSSTGSVEDTRPQTITFETGTVEDTSTPADTSDTGVIDGLAQIALFPDDLVVHTGASFPLRALGTWTDGSIAALSPALQSSDPLVATVDADGLVTATGVGEVTLSASQDGHEASVSLTVSDDGLVSVTIVSAEDGSPLSNVSVAVADGAPLTTDKDGTISIPVDDGGGPIDVSAFVLQTYVPATVWGTISRKVTIPLHTRAAFWADNAQLEGDVDFSALDGGSGGDMTIGLVVPSFQHGPLMIEPKDFMAEDRTVSMFGLKTDVPANLTLKEHAEGYQASTPADSGSGAAWVIAGTFPIGEITGALDAESSDTEGALTLLSDNIEEMRWGWSSISGLSAGETAATNLHPSVSFSDSVGVTTGDLPAGFAGTERPLVMVGSVLPEGSIVVTGMRLGVGALSVNATPADAVDGAQDRVAMAIAQVGGIGSGGAITASWAPVSGGEAELLSYQDTSTLHDFDAVTHAFGLGTDPRSSYVQLLLRSQNGSARIVYLDGGEVAGVLSDPGLRVGYANLSWRILSLETTANTFEGLVRDGDLVAKSLATRAWTSTMSNVQTEFREEE